MNAFLSRSTTSFEFLEQQSDREEKSREVERREGERMNGHRRGKESS
jgi:hypothetical protein